MRKSNIDLPEWRERVLSFEEHLNRTMLGMKPVIRCLVISIFSRGHVLLEGDVGVGKTTLLRAAARLLGGEYQRIEGAVDLMPSDFLYHAYLDKNGQPAVAPGPLLQHEEKLAVFFFNEINRARPQAHSLLLRLMAERSVNAFNREYHFPHLTVFADRNRLEREETFELPAAARDRFFMEISVNAPTDPATRKQLIFDTRFHDVDTLIDRIPTQLINYRKLDEIGARIQHVVHVSDTMQDYVLALWNGLRYPDTAGITLEGIDMAALVTGGASPRGMAMLVRAAKVRAWLEGRDTLLPDDIRAVFYETVAHRVFLDPLYAMQQDEILPALCDAIFNTIDVP